jgi:SAM-dependent methyltransferase
VLELVCGTGEWTVELARYATRLTALDASPEMLALTRRRVGAANVRYVRADVFAWTPPGRYDVVFFSAWLTHVPPQPFDAFWALLAAGLGEQGRVFVIDELPAVAAHERVIASAPAPSVERELETGARYRTVRRSTPRPRSKRGRPRSDGGRTSDRRLALLLCHRPPHQRPLPHRWAWSRLAATRTQFDLGSTEPASEPTGPATAGG